MTELATLLILLAAIAGVAAALRRTSGRIVTTPEEFSPAELATLGVGNDGVRLLLFTAPGCAPCTTARRVLDAAATRHAATVASVEVTDHAQLARDKHIWRAPTVFVLPGRGQPAVRISGVPRDDLLDELLSRDPALA